MKRLLRFLKPYLLNMTVGPAFKLIEAIFELIVPLVMADMIDHLPQCIASGDTAYLWQRGGIMVLLGMVGLASALTCQTLASRASQGVGTDLRREVFAHINTLSWRELDRFGTPTMITRMTTDINQLQTAVAMLIRTAIRWPFLIIGAMIMAMRIDLQLSLVFLAVLPAMVAVLWLVMGRSVPFFRLIQKKTDHVGMVSRENLSGARVVRAFRKQDSEFKRFDDACDDLADNSIHIGRLNAIVAPCSFLVLNMAVLVVLWFGGKGVNTGRMTQGEVVAFVNYLNQIMIALIAAANLVVIFTKAAASATRINEIFDTVPSIEQETDAAVMPVKDAPRVSFRNVSFRYHPEANDALKHITLDMSAGESLGIIGSTGMGKSTLVQLIPRLYDATAGEVLVDGVDVRHYPLWQLHQKIGMVPQGNLLFSGTVRENLCWRKPDASDEELWNALRTAQAAEFVEKLPDQLDAPVSQSGANFSGGQKQRLTIARALVGDPDLLILDDSSSALDYATDAALQKALRRMNSHPTVITVSQRVSTVRRCSRILVLEDGEVVGLGTHEELLATCPVYQQICASQMSSGEASR